MGIKLTDVDENFKVESPLGIENLVYHDIKTTPFQIYGADQETFTREGLWRIPEDVAKECGLTWGANCTAGFRVRFQTDSEYVAVKVVFVDTIGNRLGGLTRMACDLYVDHYNSSIFAKRMVPDVDVTDRYEGIAHLETRKKRYFTLYLPTYTMVKAVYIGLEEGAFIGPGREYLDVKPVVYYGSSITQGGTCHRPGNTYQSVISRRNNVDHKNLGFSGMGMAQIPIMEYISGLDMSVFVYDGLNTKKKGIEFLKSIHERGFKIVREKNPELPIIILSWPRSECFDTEKHLKFLNERRVVEMQTFINAVNSGDENVYFIDGTQYFNVPDGDICTTDGSHPTDYGFLRMADIIGNEIDRILRRKL